MAGGYKALKPEDGKQFSSTYQPLKNGRKPKVFSQIANEFKAAGIERATPEIVAEAYEYLLALPLSDILEISGNLKVENDMPSLMRMAAKEMTGKRGIEILKEMLDRAHGKAKQSVETQITGKDGGAIQFANIPLETRIAALKLLEGEDGK